MQAAIMKTGEEGALNAGHGSEVQEESPFHDGVWGYKYTNSNYYPFPTLVPNLILNHVTHRPRRRAVARRAAAAVRPAPPPIRPTAL